MASCKQPDHVMPCGYARGLMISMGLLITMCMGGMGWVNAELKLSEARFVENRSAISEMKSDIKHLCELVETMSREMLIRAAETRAAETRAAETRAAETRARGDK